MKKIAFLIIMILVFPLFVNAADCTREGTQWRVSNADDGFTGLVTEGSGPYNYYCLNIGHCLAKDGKYYNINSEQVTLEQYYASCGCRVEGTTYYDRQGNETTQANYNHVCNNVEACSIVNGHYYDNNYNEVTQSQYETICGCRTDGTHYYDRQGNETTQANYNNVCLNIGACSVVDGKYYDNNYNEVTETQFKAICGCRESGGKYYDRNGNETTQEIYDAQCNNPNTGVRNVLLIIIPAIILFLGGLFAINRRKQINEL